MSLGTLYLCYQAATVALFVTLVVRAFIRSRV